MITEIDESNRNEPGRDLSPKTAGVYLAAIILAAMILSAMGSVTGIRFPDERQYLNGAWLLATRGAISIPAAEITDEGKPDIFHVHGRNGRLYSMNPVGFSLFLAPLYLLGGLKMLMYANRLLIPPALLLCYRLGRRFFNRRDSVLGVLLLGISPVFILFSTVVMSHLLSLVILLALLCILWNRRGDISMIRLFTAAFIAGAAMIVRLDFCMVIIILLTAAAVHTFPAGEFSVSNWFERMRWKTLTVLIGFAVGSTIHFAYQAWFMGSAVKSGYQEFYTLDSMFSPANVPAAIPRIIALISRAGIPLTLGLGILGLLWLLDRKPRQGIVFLSWIAAYFSLYSLFRYGSKHIFNVRYFLPVIPVFTFSAAWFLNTITRKSRSWIMPLFVVILTGVNGWMSVVRVHDRNAAVISQERMLDRIREMSGNAIVFAPDDMGLLLELTGRYHVRSITALDTPGSRPPPPRKSREPGQWENRQRIIQPRTASTTAPDILTRTLQHYPDLPVFLVLPTARRPEFESRIHRPLKPMGTVTGRAREMGLFQLLREPAHGNTPSVPSTAAAMGRETGPATEAL